MLVLLFYLLNKKTKFANYKSIVKQIVVGIAFGISSAFASENGVVISPKIKIVLHGTETVDDYNEDSILGIYSYGATATFSNYSLLTDKEADNKFNSIFN